MQERQRIVQRIRLLAWAKGPKKNDGERWKPENPENTLMELERRKNREKTEFKRYFYWWFQSSEFTWGSSIFIYTKIKWFTIESSFWATVELVLQIMERPDKLSWFLRKESWLNMLHLLEVLVMQYYIFFFYESSIRFPGRKSCEHATIWSMLYSFQVWNEIFFS